MPHFMNDRSNYSQADMEQLKKAVHLSQEKYCGVSYVYKKAMEVTYEIQLNQSAK